MALCHADEFDYTATKTIKNEEQQCINSAKGGKICFEELLMGHLLFI